MAAMSQLSAPSKTHLPFEKNKIQWENIPEVYLSDFSVCISHVLAVCFGHVGLPSLTLHGLCGGRENSPDSWWYFKIVLDECVCCCQNL